MEKSFSMFSYVILICIFLTACSEKNDNNVKIKTDKVSLVGDNKSENDLDSDFFLTNDSYVYYESYTTRNIFPFAKIIKIDALDNEKQIIIMNFFDKFYLRLCFALCSSCNDRTFTPDNIIDNTAAFSFYNDSDKLLGRLYLSPYNKAVKIKIPKNLFLRIYDVMQSNLFNAELQREINPVYKEDYELEGRWEIRVIYDKER